MRSKKELRKKWRYHWRRCMWYTITGNYGKYGYHAAALANVNDELEDIGA